MGKKSVSSLLSKYPQGVRSEATRGRVRPLSNICAFATFLLHRSAKTSDGIALLQTRPYSAATEGLLGCVVQLA